jgi:sigma-E factor negative regulatory protein RseB
MRHLPLFCVVALLSGPAPATAGEDAAAWLLQVSDAARQANYQGVVVYRDGQRMEVMRLVHRQHDGRVQERLTSLTGKPRDILREGDTVACLVGDEPVQSSGPQTLSRCCRASC